MDKLTVWDQYALAALPQLQRLAYDRGKAPPPQSFALSAAAMADAMMAERKKRGIGEPKAGGHG